MQARSLTRILVHFTISASSVLHFYVAAMLPRRNESLDTRPVNAMLPTEHWDSLAIPCVHYVNYNFEEGNFANSDHGKMEKMNIEETMAVLTRCSFDEAHRQPIFNLGGIRALAELIQVCNSL